VVKSSDLLGNTAATILFSVLLIDEEGNSVRELCIDSGSTNVAHLFSKRLGVFLDSGNSSGSIGLQQMLMKCHRPTTGIHTTGETSWESYLPVGYPRVSTASLAMRLL
jgi:hypothetical protein